MKRCSLVIAIAMSLPILTVTAHAQFPLILGAAVDSTNNTLTISGQNFNQVSVVTLGGTVQLPVQGTPTNTQIVTSGVNSVKPGSYLLRITFSNGTAANFAVTISTTPATLLASSWIVATTFICYVTNASDTAVTATVTVYGGAVSLASFAGAMAPHSGEYIGTNPAPGGVQYGHCEITAPDVSGIRANFVGYDANSNAVGRTELH